MRRPQRASAVLRPATAAALSGVAVVGAVASSSSLSSNAQSAMRVPPAAPGPQFAADWESAVNNTATAKLVFLKPTRSPHRVPSVYFSRHAAASSSNADAPTSAMTALSAGGSPPLPAGVVLADKLHFATPLYKVTSPTCDYFALRIPLLKAGFKRLGPQHAGVDANVLWGKSWPASAFRVSTTTDVKWQHARPVHRFQTINHFAGSHATMGCKAGMAKALESASRAVAGQRPRSSTDASPTGAGEVDRFAAACPRTWRLPEQRAELAAEVAATAAGRARRRFIVKPARGSCGRGIRVVTADDTLLQRLTEAATPAQLGALMSPPPPASDGVAAAAADANLTPPPPPLPRLVVVQEYMEDPLLIEGRKFDLRLYVGVTSFDPLVAYLHQDGLVRFAAQAYSADDASNRFGHLTNYSLGRKLEQRMSHDLAIQLGLIPPDTPYTERDDSSVNDAALGDDAAATAAPALPQVSLNLKWTMQQLNDHLLERFGQARVEQLQRDVDAIIVTMLSAASRSINAAVWRQDDGGVNRCSFELLGFDIMIDQTLRPWLIEVNTLPSLESSSTMDYHVKSNVATDLLNLAQIQLFERLPSAFSPRVEGAPLPPDPLHYVASPAANDRLVHTLHDAWRTSGPLGALGSILTRSEEAVDVAARVLDEADYSGGFRRIAPSEDSLKLASGLLLDHSAGPDPAAVALPGLPDGRYLTDAVADALGIKK